MFNSICSKQTLVNWSNESLNNRTRKVIANNTLSNLLTVFSGVIGPLIFII